MALNLKLLQAMTLNAPESSPAVLYAPSTQTPKKSALLKNVLLTNKGTSVVTVSLSVQQAGGSSRFTILPSTSIAPGATLVFDDEVTLSADPSTTNKDELWGTSTADVECVINGVERDL